MISFKNQIRRNPAVLCVHRALIFFNCGSDCRFSIRNNRRFPDILAALAEFGLTATSCTVSAQPLLPSSA